MSWVPDDRRRPHAPVPITASPTALTKIQQTQYVKAGVQLFIVKMMVRTELTEAEIIRAIVESARSEIM